MKDKDIKWNDVNSLDGITGLFKKYCFLNDCCENCNKKVRFWCKVKVRISKHQEKIITKSLNRKGGEG